MDILGDVNASKTSHRQNIVSPTCDLNSYPSLGTFWPKIVTQMLGVGDVKTGDNASVSVGNKIREKDGRTNRCYSYLCHSWEWFVEWSR